MLTKILILIILFLQQPFSSLKGVDFVSNLQNNNSVSEMQTSSAPTKNSESLGIELTASSALVIDRKTGAFLFEKDPYKKVPIASLTKIMTNLVVLEYKSNLDDVVIIENDLRNIEGADIDLEKGEQIRLRDLVYGSLIASGNDAAIALAEYLSGNIEKFVEEMNKKAKDLNLDNTHFSNPSGLDSNNNYSTAVDLVRLFNYSLNNPVFAEAVQMKEYTAYSLNLNKTHLFRNTNQLLKSFLNIKGGKTGYTDEAGYCLIVLAENDQGNQIISIVLGSKDSFQETKALVDWAFKNYKW